MAGVRNYIKEMIMRIIEVHAEVFAVSPVFVTRVTQKVIEAVSEELTRLVQCVTEHGPYSPIQVGHTQGLTISYRLVTMKALQTYTLIGHTRPCNPIQVGHTKSLAILYR